MTMDIIYFLMRTIRQKRFRYMTRNTTTPRMKPLLSLLFVLFAFSLSAQADLDAGKALFRNNCASCHNKSMKDDMTGPALGGVEERWESEELLYAWIRNSSAVIATGDAYAVGLYNEWNKSVMTAFPNLSDEEIASVLGYIDGVYKGTYPKGGVVVADTPVGAETEESGLSTPFFIVLFLILAILAVALARIISNLNRMAQIKEGAAPGQVATIKDILTSRGVIGFIIFAAVIIGGFTTVNNAISLGRQQGYAPDQPIKFSHALHAGQQQIDCQYCHDGARRSKHSVIPATNTCMNCHKAIKKGSEYGTAELSKIYASIGYDPTTDKYLENYEDMTNEEIKPIFVKYAKETFLKDKAAEPRYANSETKLERDATEEAEKQWENIEASLTNPSKENVGGAIEWVRIHNLPDHVYFNHAQHVTVGKLACQTCHGPIEKMEVVQQYAPLSMGWCINCHRQTEVQFASNEYYDQYETYHKELKAGKREVVTVEDIGGLECQKCHY